MTIIGPADLHLSTGAMALDALPAEEAERFQDHLAHCETCAEEFRGLQATAAMLGAAEAIRPPARLRVWVLDAAARTPQLPPEVLAPVGRHRHTSEPTTGAPLTDTPTTDVIAIGSAPSPRASWIRRPVGWLAAAAAVVLIGGGLIWGINAGHTAPPTASELSQCVVADPAATTLTPKVGAGGSLTRSDSCGAVLLNLPSMAALGTGQGYQMWLIDGNKAAKSLGMVNNLNGAMVPLQFHQGDQSVAVTVEPSAGSEKPSHDPVWQVNLH